MRPLLVRELVAGLDLYGRDRARRAAAALPGLLAFRLPIFGALPALPTPPIFIPGLGVMSVTDAVRCDSWTGLQTVCEILSDFGVHSDRFESGRDFGCAWMSWLSHVTGRFVHNSQHSGCHIDFMLVSSILSVFAHWHLNNYPHDLLARPHLCQPLWGVWC